MIQRDTQVGDAVLCEAITHAVSLLVSAYGHLPSAHIDMLTDHLKSLLAIQMERVVATS